MNPYDVEHWALLPTFQSKRGNYSLQSQIWLICDIILEHKTNITNVYNNAKPSNLLKRVYEIQIETLNGILRSHSEHFFGNDKEIFKYYEEYRQYRELKGERSE